MQQLGGVEGGEGKFCVRGGAGSDIELRGREWGEDT